MSLASAPAAARRRPEGGPAHPALPGLLLSLGVGALATLLTAPWPTLSPLVVAILLGAALGSTGLLTGTSRAIAAAGRAAVLEPGLAVASRSLLRLGIVLLGLDLVLGDLLALGPGVLLAVVGVVAGGILGTLLLGRLLRVDAHLTLLVACGFSICGAAAVAATAGVTDPRDERSQDTASAVALVVLCGTAMILVLPALARLLGLGPSTSGLWAGAAIHEVAQVVAAGGVIGGGALALAVPVKLARVLLLAPTMAVLAGRARLRARREAAGGGSGRLPALVPPFVLGFLALVLLRSAVPLPQEVLTVAGTLRTVLLGAAMFALGCGVRPRALLAQGPRPLLLAVTSTALVAGLALTGVLLAG